MYPPHHLGGYELSCRDVVERLRGRGHDVTVLTTTMRVPGVADVAGEREAGIRRDLEFYFRAGDLWSPSVAKRIAFERHNQRVLRGVLDDVQPDVVSVWHMGAMSLGLLTTLVESGVPLVYAVCDDWLTYGLVVDRWMSLFRRRRSRWLAPVARRVVGVPTTVPDLGRSGTFLFVSELTRQRSEAASPWTFPDSTVVYSGIDRTDFPVPAAHERRRPWRWRLLYVGRLVTRQGSETGLPALSRLPPEATLSIVGRGSAAERRRVDAVVAELGLAARVAICETDRAGLRAHYLSADAFVFPSEWEEPFGLVPVEAMACATPVVATAAGGSGEFLVDGANCLRFRAGEPDTLAATLERLAADEALRDRLVAGGLHTAAELDVDRLADAFEAWHDAAAAGFADGRPADRPPPVPPASG
jgi:glycosyltransferase involved in cell wall biosynthesis